MLKLNHYLLASASLALVAFASVPQANAATCNGDTNCSLGSSAYTFGANDVFGGGSTLIAPYLRQLEDCYFGNTTTQTGYADLISKGSSTNNPTFVDETLFNYTGTAAQNCATSGPGASSDATAWYIGAGSGAGIASLYSHDTQFNGKYGEANTNGPQYLPEEIYSASDAGLSGPVTTSGTDLYNYVNGGTEQGLSIGAPGAVTCTSGSTTPYPNPAQCYGPLIQFPISIDTVAVAFNPVYEKLIGPGKKLLQYKFRTAAIHFSEATLCGIFNATITNWNDSHITADNGGTPLESASDPTPAGSWSVPIFAVGRSDSSGTTSIVTRHLANICSAVAGNQYANGATTLPASLQGSTYTTGTANYPGIDQAGKITLASGNSGVAYYTAFTAAPNGFGNKCPGATKPAGYTDCIQQGRIAYVGADYVTPYVKTTQTVSVTLFPAELQNHAGVYLKPTPVGAAHAFGAVLPPQTNKNGTFNASMTGNGLRSDPSAWAESTDKGQPLAEPTASNAYPIVGTTNILLYQCYANATTLANLKGLLNYENTSATITDSKLGILAKAGLAPLPSAWLSAVRQAFLTGSDGLGLNIAQAGSAGACASVVGG